MNSIEIKAKIADLNLITLIIKSKCDMLLRQTENDYERNEIITHLINDVDLMQKEIKELTEMIDY